MLDHTNKEDIISEEYKYKHIIEKKKWYILLQNK
jgi:hypothetical protein